MKHISQSTRKIIHKLQPEGVVAFPAKAMATPLARLWSDHMAALNRFMAKPHDALLMRTVLHTMAAHAKAIGLTPLEAAIDERKMADALWEYHRATVHAAITTLPNPHNGNIHPSAR